VAKDKNTSINKKKASNRCLFTYSVFLRAKFMNDKTNNWFFISNNKAWRLDIRDQRISTNTEELQLMFLNA